NRGEAVGEYLGADGAFHGFLWKRGRFTRLDVPGAGATSATAINDRGLVIGSHVDPAGARIRGFLLHHGRYRSFDAPGAQLTAPFAINNRGQIVGTAYADPTATTGRGFLLPKGIGGRWTPIDFPGASSTVVLGINDHGRISGGYLSAVAPSLRQAPAPATGPGDPRRMLGP
ncbi:MAG TPA: hypothetical protein VGF21_09785, partial [Thermoleophilaceae bacterium]